MCLKLSVITRKLNGEMHHLLSEGLLLSYDYMAI
jgi:hypothetical protein